MIIRVRDLPGQTGSGVVATVTNITITEGREVRIDINTKLTIEMEKSELIKFINAYNTDCTKRQKLLGGK